MNQILQQMLDAVTGRGIDSKRIIKEEDRITIAGDEESSLIAEIKDGRLVVLVSHGPDEPNGFLNLFNSKIENMGIEDERVCIDAYGYGLDLMKL